MHMKIILHYIDMYEHIFRIKSEVHSLWFNYILLFESPHDEWALNVIGNEILLHVYIYKLDLYLIQKWNCNFFLLGKSFLY